MKIVKAEVKDAAEVARLSLLLWPEHDIEEMELEFRELIQMDDAAVFLAREGWPWGLLNANYAVIMWRGRSPALWVIWKGYS